MCIFLDSCSPQPRPLTVIFFRTGSGNEPVREWLKSLPTDERKQIGADILAVQYGWPLGLPLVDSLGQGLWEVRSRTATRIARTIFFVSHDTVILLHGFIKKTRATPAHDLNLARKRKHDYEQAQESQSRQ
jgi:phage-related protein